MTAGDRTPVLVGVAAVAQREADPARALEPTALMARALERAADDAGSRDWLARAELVGVPRGFWEYRDPGRLVAHAVGALRARTLFADVGVLQTTLFARACRAIREGADVVLVTGGEAKHRAQAAQRAGVEAPLTAEAEGVEPDEVLRPAGAIVGPLELAAGLAVPVRQYAVLDNALRFAEGQGVAAHRDEVARLWADMSRVAAANPHAWSREEVAPEAVRDAVGANRMLAFPYTRLHTSQWNVDQAAGLVFASAGAARRAGVPESRWVRPRAVVESDFMLPLVERAELHRCPAFGIAGCRAHELSGLSPADVSRHELYSCFPSAVRIQQRELGLDPARPVTVTGGMAFAGGPLNNFVLQAAVRLAELLRGEPGAAGMLTAVSGFLTKQGVSLWSSGAGGEAFASADVSAEAERATARVRAVEGREGEARVAGYTVLHGEGPERTVALCDFPDGTRTVASSADPDLARRASTEELCGRAVRVEAGELRVGG